MSHVCSLALLASFVAPEGTTLRPLSRQPSQGTLLRGLRDTCTTLHCLSPPGPRLSRCVRVGSSSSSSSRWRAMQTRGFQIHDRCGLLVCECSVARFVPPAVNGLNLHAGRCTTLAPISTTGLRMVPQMKLQQLQQGTPSSVSQATRSNRRQATRAPTHARRLQGGRTGTSSGTASTTQGR
jgi:hypothetical protein